jgi:hypothetical protein
MWPISKILPEQPSATAQAIVLVDGARLVRRLGLEKISAPLGTVEMWAALLPAIHAVLDRVELLERRFDTSQ